MRMASLLFTLFFTSQIFAQLSDLEILEQAANTPNPNEALALLKKITEPENLADSARSKCYLEIGIAYGKLGIADSSMMYLDKCLEIAEASNDDFHQMSAFNSMGVLLRIQGKHEESLDAFQNALGFAEKHDTRMYLVKQSEILGNIGGIFYQLQEYAAAKGYTSRGLTKAISNADTSEMAYDYLRLAIVYQAEDSVTQSLTTLQQASQFLEKIGDYATLIYAESTLSSIHKKKGALDSALIHVLKAKEFSEASGDVSALAHSSIAAAEIYLERQRLNLANRMADEGLAIAEKGNFPIHSKNATDLLYRIAVKKGQYQKALELRNLVVNINDSLTSAEAKERLADVETKYETEKKEAEIKRLSLENNLQDANLARSRNAQYAIGTGSILAITLLVVFFTLRSKKQKAEQEAQELQIEALQKRLFDMNLNPYEKQLNLDGLNKILNTPLTEREFETLDLSLQEKSNTQIADQLFISKSTVKFHLRNTYKKLGVGNRREALAYINKSS